MNDDTPLYDAAMAAVGEFYSHADEMFAAIDAIADRDEKLRKLVALVKDLQECQRLLREIRMRAVDACVYAEIHGFHVPGPAGRWARTTVKKIRAFCDAFMPSTS